MPVGRATPSKPGDKVKVVGNAAKDPATKLMLMKDLYGYTASGMGSELDYSITLEDPKTFTRQWTAQAKFKLQPNFNIVESSVLKTTRTWARRG